MYIYWASRTVVEVFRLDEPRALAALPLGVGNVDAVRACTFWRAHHVKCEEQMLWQQS